jgi:hypothetical protein
MAIVPLYSPPKDKKNPARAALIKLDRLAAMSARIPYREISSLRLGATAPNPPSKMAIDDKLAKPQSAKMTTA